jgi:hypothetical protein
MERIGWRKAVEMGWDGDAMWQVVIKFEVWGRGQCGRESKRE